MALDSVERRFLQGLVGERPPARSSEVAVSFCRHFGIGLQVASRVEYADADFTRARQLLEANGVPIAPLADVSRAEAAQHTGMSEKSGTRAPHAGSVAIKALGACAIDGHTLWAPPRGYCVWDLADASRISADRILIVENLETFREIESYAWIDRGSHRVLVVFRGDRDLSAADSLQLLQRRSEPVWAFVDFDPAGLGIAASLPRLERLVLPPRAWIQPRLKGDRALELYDRSCSQWLATIEAAENRQIRAAWALMHQRRAGMSQEAMREYKLA